MLMLRGVLPAGFAVLLVAVGVRSANFEPPAWAYPEIPRAPQVVPVKALLTRAPVSTRMPRVVSVGRAPDVQACSSCHLDNGLGYPASSSLAGLSVEYFTMELANFKSGSRHSSLGETPMASIARALTADEASAAAAYYSTLPRLPWITVVEADMVPKTRIAENGIRVPLGAADMEPLGERIIEVPKFPERMRGTDPNSPFIAYVPRGSIRRGRAFVSTGGAVMRGAEVVVPGTSVACANCHGVTLRGMAHAPDSDVPVPPIVGRSPTYIIRQLYDVHSGARSAPSTTLMKPIAAQMTLQQMIDAAAYLASKQP
jgi:cytochrome c553